LQSSVAETHASYDSTNRNLYLLPSIVVRTTRRLRFDEL
jgi:hypothetical protein